MVVSATDKTIGINQRGEVSRATKTFFGEPFKEGESLVRCPFRPILAGDRDNTRSAQQENVNA